MFAPHRQPWSIFAVALLCGFAVGYVVHRGLARDLLRTQVAEQALNCLRGVQRFANSQPRRWLIWTRFQLRKLIANLRGKPV